MRFTKIAAVLATAALFSIPTSAQRSHPTDKWPYLFNEFQETTVRQTKPNTVFNGKVNVCADDGKLHYINEEGVIMEAYMSDIAETVINGRKFVNVYNKLYEVLAENENGSVILETKVKAPETGADSGYGMKSNTYAVQNVDLASAVGFGNAFVHSRLEEAAREREYGNALDVEEQLYIRVGHDLVKADKSTFRDFVGKDNAKKFLKEVKIKWNDPESILQAVDYIKGM